MISVRVAWWSKREPTAKQVVPRQVAPPRVMGMPVGSGLESNAHLVPFQCSSAIFRAPAASRLPTARQFLLDTHATPDRRLRVWLVGVGLGTTFHAEPFQRSTSESVRDLLGSW